MFVYALYGKKKKKRRELNINNLNKHRIELQIERERFQIHYWNIFSLTLYSKFRFLPGEYKFKTKKIKKNKTKHQHDCGTTLLV
jgi:hypothetical protein